MRGDQDDTDHRQHRREDHKKNGRPLEAEVEEVLEICLSGSRNDCGEWIGGVMTDLSRDASGGIGAAVGLSASSTQSPTPSGEESGCSPALASWAKSVALADSAWGTGDSLTSGLNSRGAVRPSAGGGGRW